MAQIQVIFNGTAQDLQDFCDALHYQATLGGQANPETQAYFFARKVKQYAASIVATYRS